MYKMLFSNFLLKTSLFLAVCVMLFSCGDELHMTFPEGPDGKSAYEVWVDEVNNGNIDWPQDRTDINNFFLYLKGEDGTDGKSAYELWLEEVNNGLENPHNPGNEWPKDKTEMSDFWYYLTGADGEDGVTPNIGDNGNWWINGEDTGISATGADGQDGDMPDITIGDDGHWYINGEDTGVSATGEDGAPGKSAYQLWIEAVTSVEGLDDPHNPGQKWPVTEIGIDDFWRYLRGKDGEDGEIVIQPQPTEGMYNVIAQYSIDGREYINWESGTVKYLVYDKNLDPLPYVTVSNMPNLPNKIYTTDDKGCFYVPNTDLPTNIANSANSFGSAVVNGENTSNKTFVPCQMSIRLRLQGSPRFEELDAVWAFDIPGIEVPFVVERKVDANSNWETVPAHVGNTYCQVHIYSIDTDEEVTLSYIDEYDLSKDDGVVLAYRKIINSKDGVLSGEKLAEYAQANNITNATNRPIEWWGEYHESDKHFYTIGFGSGNDGCYGQSLRLVDNAGNAVAIEDVPIQPMPMLDEILIYDWDVEKDILYPAMKICSDNSVESLDAKVYEGLLLEKDFELSSQTVNGHQTYIPKQIDKQSFYSEKTYSVQYSCKGQNTMTPSQPLLPLINGNIYDGYFTFQQGANAVEGSIIQLRPTNIGKYNFFSYSFAEIYINSNNEPELKNLTGNENNAILTRLPRLMTVNDFAFN